MAKKTKQASQVDPKVLDAVRSLVGYMWDDEVEDACEQSPEDVASHVIQNLVRVRNWLDGTRVKVSEVLGENGYDFDGWEDEEDPADVIDAELPY